MFDAQTFQVFVFLLNGIWGLFMLFLSFYLSRANKSLEKIQEQFKELNDEVLKHYVTRAELEIVRKYTREIGHDLREDMGWLTSCMYLLAQKSGMLQDLPVKPRRGD